MLINNKPEHTKFTKLYEDKSECLRVEICGVTNQVDIIQYDEKHPSIDGLNKDEIEWLISILKDSLKLIENE